MPDLASRTQHETELTAAIAAVLSAHGGRGQWWELNNRLMVALTNGLRLVFIDAANGFYAEQGLTTDPARLNSMAHDWADLYGRELANAITTNLQAGTDDAIQRTRAAAIGASEQEVQRNLTNALLTLFGEERASNIAITETTRAITAGEFTAAGSIRGTSSGRYVAVDRQGQVIGGQRFPGQERPTDQPPGETTGKRLSLVAHWNTERDSLVCPVCRPLYGKPQGEWGPFSNGPPAHPRCRCWLNWRVPVSEN